MTESCDNSNEGLRLLARMIARRLMAEKPDVDGPRPYPGLPAGVEDLKTGLQSSGKDSKKQAVPPSDCKRLDAGCPDESGNVDG